MRDKNNEGGAFWIRTRYEIPQNNLRRRTMQPSKPSTQDKWTQPERRELGATCPRCKEPGAFSWFTRRGGAWRRVRACYLCTYRRTWGPREDPIARPTREGDFLRDSRLSKNI
jgi:hypothetical protein